MKRRFEFPANWQDFEDLCFALSKFIWNDMYAKKNGRQGQPQNGVDIYGQPNLLKDFVGIQCKGKNAYLNQKLTLAEIKEELLKAKSFKPKIKVLEFLTTAYGDSVLDEQVRKFNYAKHGAGIRPALKSWEEIETDLLIHTAVAKAFYNPITVNQGWRRVNIGSYEANVEMKVFESNIFELFEDKLAKMFISYALRVDFQNVIVELIINAVINDHTKACSIRLGSKEISIECEGKYFDLVKYISNPNLRRGGGLREFELFLEKYKSEVTFENNEVDAGRKYTFSFKSELSEVRVSSAPYQIEFGPRAFHKTVVDVPKDADSLLIVLTPEMANMSSGYLVVYQTLEKMKAGVVLNLDLRKWGHRRDEYLLDRFGNEIKSGRIVLVE